MILYQEVRGSVARQTRSCYRCYISILPEISILVQSIKLIARPIFSKMTEVDIFGQVINSVCAITMQDIEAKFRVTSLGLSLFTDNYEGTILKSDKI
ncbi:hypothetical protein CEXT_426371 [Caerostris extrusa]|uniref:Uncharacterized protein n=1 Tax=Caerostris extrusa TaxID=172846 RepID=A0AAV4SRM5_CAEEX|nr:hypothetical protein CEXT_426371 [Caerostris extrusa]